MSETTIQPTTQTPTEPRARGRSRRGRIARITALVATGVVAAGLGGGYLWLSATSEPLQTGQAECEEAPVSLPETMADASVEDDVRAVCDTIGSLTEAWAVHDADAYGEAFTEQGTYTTFMGTHYAGREDIVESHRELFDGPLEGTQLADSFLSINFVHEDVAVVTTRGDTYEGDVPERLAKVQTYNVTRTEGDEWRISSFHNTKRDGAMERLQFLMMPDSRPAAER
ncbi:SgcJ/EcaC family oxidoreductase [Spiractinospora alimapuensis]|uniref:SgcJ/EcaC family oxidoreductase n=1 Tax=Spiractinospora alimapuensis TaxID=2820884 RepID=UPI001F45821B|nr:SgcJ/EcaC family oxidoreductase [Spiractinospora alimapuensis]QVQ50889.1 SgcJ/EcaC family oxidoreductase [Spiractinospora alimapuensis]